MFDKPTFTSLQTTGNKFLQILQGQIFHFFLLNVAKEALSLFLQDT